MKGLNKFNKIISVIITIAIITCALPVDVMAGEVQYRLNVNVVVDGNDVGYISAFDDQYENNLFISIKGIAYALKGTQKCFSVSVEKSSINVETGRDFDSDVPYWNEEEIKVNSDASAKKHELTVDGRQRKYPSFIFPRNGGRDAFFSPVSLALMLDVKIDVTADSITIDTSKPYSVTADELEQSGYLQDISALAIGDATTGEIFYTYNEDPFPIASTTKLMTYFVFMDEVAAGRCSLSDMAYISEGAGRLSKSPDGVVPMTAGANVPVVELLYGMLLPSSNECAYAIAEHVAGSQDAFVEMMNEKAASLGLTNAVFYNAHGLPKYDDQFLPAKMQNHMTASEMFYLTSALLKEYPQVTDITSTKSYHLDVLNKDIKSTNVVLYNMDNAVGLKTGTTNRAGACLVTCVQGEKDGAVHNLVTVLLGAVEDSSRGLISEISERYALKALEEGVHGTVPVKESEKESDNKIPDDPELVVKKLIKLIESK